MAGLCEGGNEPPGSLKAIRFESGPAHFTSRPAQGLRSPSRLTAHERNADFSCALYKGGLEEGVISYKIYTKGSTITSAYEMNSRSLLYFPLSLRHVRGTACRLLYSPLHAARRSPELRGARTDSRGTCPLAGRVIDPRLAQYKCYVSSIHRMSLASKETLRGHSDSSFRGEGYIQCCVGVRLCDIYSNQELAEIHFMCGKADGNAALARRLYQERYPQRQCPDRKTFVRLHYRLCEYGKFNSPGLGRGRPRSTTAEVQEEILEAVNMTPSISTRRVALQVNVPHTTVWRLLKEYQLYPYHLQRVQALSPVDYPARVRFCQWFLQQCGVNPNFPALVLFTDEAQFTRDGITNFHNQHENPRATVPSHHQVRFSLNIGPVSLVID
ncbi:hypothetical protein ANN_18832 [Periplaneta americana]|uniref:DUF4817 domain-containing protein n=1 Tax=Periplaneta americana TaxID=6978 RepID=A0ABQ8SR91_PERAM|nr:hypothetical protein ANN_18832 [Periplaneta americana]